jgi:threonine synthase
MLRARRQAVYRSTRSEAAPRSASQALLEGLALDGGLYVPAELPRLDPRLLSDKDLSYAELSSRLLGPFFPEFAEAELRSACERAAVRFPADPAPIVAAGSLRFLELFHGPTLAFKDFALSLMGSLSRLAAKAEGFDGELLVLAATSGDTGKAALAGFEGVERTRVLVFYPAECVSGIQRLQMLTHDAPGAEVVGIRGNFDEAQRGVKALFADRGLAADLAARGISLSSANSINIARLLPQIVYYLWAYRNEVASGDLSSGEKLNVAVPTGNFGDALAAWYAKSMGLPLGEIAIASNRNRVLADFFSTYVYDRNRPFFKTESPSMDILAASNLERLLFEAVGRDSERCAALMDTFGRTGRIELAASEAAYLGAFRSGSADDDEAAAAIRAVFEESGYLMDTHTAVAATVARRLVAEPESTWAGRPALVLATASPFKFPAAVARAIGLPAAADEVATAAALAARAGLELPSAIARLAEAPIRHREVVETSEMEAALRRFAGEPR